MLGEDLRPGLLPRLRESGIHYGPFFQSIAQLWRYDGEMLGEVQMPDGPEAEFNAYQIPPGDSGCLLADSRGCGCCSSD